MPSFLSERKFVRKDGSSIWVNRTVSLVHDANGKPLYFIRIIEDISERKQAEDALRTSEQRYRSVIDVMAEGVVVRDRDGLIVTCNSSGERILGRTLAQMRGQRRFDPEWQVIREDGSTCPDNERPSDAALLTGKAQLNVVMGLRKPDGTVLWIMTHSQPLFDESGTTPNAVVSTITDITQRKLAEQRQTMEHRVTRLLLPVIPEK